MSAEIWTWQADRLLDPRGVEVALVRDGIIHVGRHHILPEIDRAGMRFTVSATTSQGEVFSLAQSGFTVSRLTANCGERSYLLDRPRCFRRERQLAAAAGDIIARTRPRGDDLEVFDHPAECPVPDLDFVFLTWACREVDNSGRIHA